MFNRCYNMMKSNMDKRQSDVKKYDERVRLTSVSSNHDSSYVYDIYNHDCKLTVTATMKCDWQDGGVVRWYVVMEYIYDGIENHKSVLDMWSCENGRVYNDDINAPPSPGYVSVPINRDEYPDDVLSLQRYIKQLVSRTFHNRWYQEFKGITSDIINQATYDYPVLYSRYLRSLAAVDTSNVADRFYHLSRIDLFKHIVMQYWKHRINPEDRSGNEVPYALNAYMREMEQEDINTSIRMLF